MAKNIDFWITCGSTYTYLTVMRLAEVEAANNVQIHLRPFYLAVLFNEIGSWPFPDGAAKTAYMWRDIERRARARGLAPRLPAPYPAPETPLANRICWIAAQEPWGRDYLVAAYRAWFEQGLMPGSRENLAASLAPLGQDVDAVITRAEAAATDQAVIVNTDQARDLGVFGAPTFSVGAELFWGDDRLEDAVAWAKAH